MSFRHRFGKGMKVNEHYSIALNDAESILSRRVNVNLKNMEKITGKDADQIELVGVIEMLKKANERALIEFDKRDSTERLKTKISIFLRNPNHMPSASSLFDTIEDELTLFNQPTEIIELYECLLKLNLGIKYLLESKNLNSSYLSNLNSIFERIIILFSSKFKFKIDYAPLQHALLESVELGLFDLENSNNIGKLNLLAELEEISLQALSVLCQAYNIKN